MEKNISSKKSIFEKGPGIRSGLKDFRTSLSTESVTTGIVSGVWGAAGPCIIVMSAAKAAGFTDPQTISWLFGNLFFAGCIGLFLSLYYKMPIAGGFSIPGASMLATSLVGFNFNEASFAFIVCGLIVLFLGTTGLVGKVMRFLPLPIVMGMIFGVMLRFGTGLVAAVEAAPIVGGLTVVAFFLIPRIIKKASPLLSAFIVGVIAAIVTGGFTGEVGTVMYIAPQIARPSFNPATILSVSVPLAALVIGAENSQGMGCLRAQGYNTPVNVMTVASGIGGIFAGLVGAHNANIAGPMTCMNSSQDAGENKSHRYTGSAVCGIVFIILGIFASYTLTFLTMFPSELLNVLAGLAMINVLLNSVDDAFGTGKCKIGALFAFFIGASGLSIFNIGAAFWGLFGGVLISFLAEGEDFNHFLRGEDKKEQTI